MPSGGQSGFGTTLSGSTSGAVANITSITTPGPEAGDIDVTVMSSTLGWREHIPSGLKEAGTIEVGCWYVKAQSAVFAALVGAASQTWTITLPDGSTWACSGYVQKLGGESPLDGGITQPITIKLTGQPTFTAA